MWPQLLLMLLGTAVSNKAKGDAYERGRIERQTGREKEKKVEEAQRAEVLAEAAQLDPALRQEALDTQAAETEEQISDVLSDNELLTTGDTGVISDKLLAQRAKSTRDKANTASILAALTAKVQAPGKTGQSEQRSMSDLIGESRGRTSELGRINKTTDLLAELMSTPDAGLLTTGGLMQSLGMSGATSSIMEGLVPPGGTPAYAGVPQATPVPGYVAPDAFGVGAIR